MRQQSPSANHMPTNVPLHAESLTLSDGLDLRIWRWPHQSGKPLLHWAHATGFHARLYRPLLDHLALDFNIIAWDMRGHGESRVADPSQLKSWDQYYQDLCELIDHADQPVYLGGHSVGGTTSIIAAARRPQQVAGLLLADPVLLAPWPGFKLGLIKRLGRSDQFALAGAAAKRRALFESRQQVIERYRGRGAFKTWPDQWLEAYVRHAFVDVDNGVRLACEPAWESASFAATEHRPWSKLRTLRAPTIALAGETHSWLSPQSARKLERIHEQVQVKVIAGTTHFLPMEDPQALIDAALTLIKQA